MATQSFIKEFNSSVNNWKKLDLKKIYRDELGTASFGALKPIIEDVSTKIHRTEKITEYLSDNLLQKFYTPINGLINHFNAIAAYNEAQFVSQKTQILNQIHSFQEQILTIWPQIVSIINDNNNINNTKEVNDLLNEIKSIKNQSIIDAKNIDEIKNSLRNDLESFENRYTKELFNKAEIIKQEDAFSKDASSFKRNSNNWLVATSIFSIILIIIIISIFKNSCFEYECFNKVKSNNYNSIFEGGNRSIFYLEIFKSIAYRIFLISFNLYALSICVKNYNACMHNYTINKHKANSLSAALILLERAKTDGGNDQIMTQVANTIFSHQATGYSNKDPENISTNITDKIIERITP